MGENALVPQSQKRQSIVARFSESYGIEPDRLLQTMKSTAFRQSDNRQISNEQLCALMIVSEKYSLNPFVKEIYAYPTQGGGIVPVVGVDGWNSIMNSHPQFDGIDFRYSEDVVEVGTKKCYTWIEAVIYRKDRRQPIVAREYLDECYRDVGPWKTHPKRFLRHKALIQCARIAFGFAGIHDEDEAERIVEARAVDLPPAPPLVAPERAAVADDFQPAPDSAIPAAPRRRGRPAKSETVQEQPAPAPAPAAPEPAAPTPEPASAQPGAPPTPQEPEPPAPPLVAPGGVDVDLF